jgi:hypothetical protein
MSYHPKPKYEPPATVECPFSCRELAEDLGTMTAADLDEWRSHLVDQKRSVQLSSKYDSAEQQSLQQEINCTLKWTNQCEVDLAKCEDDCSKLKQTFQSGASQPLPRRARDFIANEAITTIEDGSKPRVEVVAAQKNLNCLLKYEECLQK